MDGELKAKAGSGPEAIAAVLVAIALAVDLASCGGDGSVTEIVEVGDVASFDANPAFAYFALASAHDPDVGLLIAWTESAMPAADDAIVAARIVDPETGSVGPELIVDHDSASWLRPLSLCAARDSSFTVVWEDAISEFDLPNGLYLDLANVRMSRRVTAEGATSQTETIDDLAIGSQGKPDVACLGDGGVAAVFNDLCSSLEVDGIVRLHGRPPECDAEPPDGTYVRFYDETGIASGPSFRVSPPERAYASGGPSIAALSDSSVLILAPYWREDDSSPVTGILRYAGDGTLLAESLLDVPPFAEIPYPLDRHRLVCDVDDRCMAVYEAGDGIVMHVVDGLVATRVQSFYARENEILEPPPHRTELAIRAHAPRIACDGRGHCMVAYVLTREELDVDAYFLTTLGAFGRAYDVVHDELGDEFELGDVFADEWAPPSVTSIGERSFVVSVFDQGTQRIDVMAYELR